MNLSDDEDNEALLTYEDVINSKDKDKWMKAIQEEIDSLNKNGTWIYVNEEEVKDKEILTSRWIFRLKDDGKYKARLVARGCFQNKNEMDYEENYSPVVDTLSLRLLFAIAAERNWKIQTLHVKTAFLHGELPGPIYVKVPESFTQPGKICEFKISPYGLRQAPCK